jgi:hypothetical protein
MKFSGNSPANVVNTAEGVFILGIAVVVLVALYKVYNGASTTITSIGSSVNSVLNAISNPLQLINGGAATPPAKVMTDLANVNENGALTAQYLMGATGADPLSWGVIPSLNTTASDQTTAIAQQLAGNIVPSAPVAVDYTQQVDNAVSGVNAP